MQKNLPPSDDKFWGDGDRETVEKPRRRQTVASCYLVRHGAYAVCTSCEYEHTVPLDFEKYELIDGKPVKRVK